MAIGKTAPNGTLNADGAFYSVQDVNVLLENAGGGGGADLPTPTIADAGSVVVVDNEGKYALGEAGGGGTLKVTVSGTPTSKTLDKNHKEISEAISNGITPVFVSTVNIPGSNINDLYILSAITDNGESTYGVILAKINSQGADPITAFPFQASSETGVLTWTTSQGNGGEAS